MPVALTWPGLGECHAVWIKAWELMRWPSMVGWPLVLSVAGWALMWASALQIVDLGSVWVPASLFVIGLALIPLAASSAARPSGTDEQLRSQLK